MAEQSAHLVDHVFPRVPVRQWVLSVPRQVRYHLARKPKLKRQVLAIFLGEVFRWMRRRLGRRGQSGAVTVVQRFGGALNLNVHFHSLVVDGIYVRGSAPKKSQSEPSGLEAPPLFIPVPAPTWDDLQRVVGRVRDRVVDLLVRRGIIGDPDLGEPDPEPAEDPGLFEQMQANSIQGFLLTSGDQDKPPVLGRDPWAFLEPWGMSDAAECEGYSLHAAVRIGADDREGLERVCRYVLRPPFAQDRFSELPDGRIIFKMRRPWRDGTSHVIMSPVELVARLAALVPVPRQHQVHYHGILAPHARWRSAVVSQCEEGETCRKRGRGRCRMGWAELMKRTFKIDVLLCPKCGGRMSLIAMISSDQQEVLRAILGSMGLPVDPPMRAPPKPARVLPEYGPARRSLGEGGEIMSDGAA